MSGIEGEPRWEEAEVTACCPLPPPEPGSLVCVWNAAEDVAHLSIGLPPLGSAWGAGETPHTAHIPGRQEAQHGEPGPVPTLRGTASSQQPPCSPPASSPGTTGFSSHTSQTKGF